MTTTAKNDTQQHTPGPWSCQEGRVWSGHRAMVAITEPTNAVVWMPRDRAHVNARLIAAAPDMLAALLYAADQDCCELDGIESKGKDACFSCAARAAIAKATGAQS